MKENGDFVRPEEENLTEISEEHRNKSWSSNTQGIKELNFLNNMRLTIRTEPIAGCQEGKILK